MPFSGGKQGFFGSFLKQGFWKNQKQTKNKPKPKKTNKEGLWPSEVALRVTSPDP